MPHQLHVLEVGLEVQSEAAGDPEPGEWAYDTVTMLGPRRIGKTTIVCPVAAHRMRRTPGGRAFMTAHNGKTAVKRWREAADLIERSPLGSEVRKRISIAFEELRWTNNSLFLPFAPNEEGLHSETPDLVFVDEFWRFSAEQATALQDSYVPAFGTTSGQAWLMTTAGTESSAWLHTEREAGRAGVAAGVNLGRAFVEYSLPPVVDGTPVDALTDPELVAACIAAHPAVCHVAGCIGARGRRPCPHGFTVRPAAIRAAWEAMRPETRRSSFLRAYGNRDAADEGERWLALEERVWSQQTDADGIPTGVGVALGVTVDEDSQDATISAGWRERRGRMHTEVLDHRVGTRWVASAVAGVVERQAKAGAPVVAVAIPNVKGSRDVADQLEAAGIEVLKVAQADVYAADTRHRDELNAGTWLHSDPMREKLAQTTGSARTAAAVAVWRGRWTKGSAPITALTSQTLAGWGYDHRPEDLGPFRIR